MRDNELDEHIRSKIKEALKQSNGEPVPVKGLQLTDEELEHLSYWFGQNAS